MHHSRAIAALAALLLPACATSDRAAPVPGPPEQLTPPAGPGSSQPFLASTRDGGVLLSWTEPTSDSTHALRYSRFLDEHWTPAHTVAEGTGWFVNWADFPSVVELPDGNLAAHWLRRSAPAGYAYDVWVSRSADGNTWTVPLRPHADRTATEHGFVTLFPRDGGLGLAWLDGRKYAGATGGTTGNHSGGEMALRFALLPAGEGIVEAELDGRTCDCCQTAVALTSAGPVVFYRDRSPEEVRDIAVTRLEPGGWTPPVPVHRDGWRIDACPVNGPAARGSDREVAVAWFTAAGDTPRVQVAVSRDAGASFGPPVRVDDGDPAGRVDLAGEAPGEWWISWLERTAEGASIRVRRVNSDGLAGPAATLASASAERATGFPRLLLHDGYLWLAWTGESGLRVLRARLQPSLPVLQPSAGSASGRPPR